MYQEQQQQPPSQFPPQRTKLAAGGPRQAPPQRRTIRRSMPPNAYGSQMQSMQQQLQSIPQPQPQPTITMPSRTPASPPSMMPQSSFPPPPPSSSQQPQQYTQQYTQQQQYTQNIPPPTQQPQQQPQMQYSSPPPPQMPQSSFPQSKLQSRAPQMYAPPPAPQQLQPTQTQGQNTIPSATTPSSGSVSPAGSPGSPTQSRFSSRNPHRKSMFPRLQMIRTKSIDSNTNPMQQQPPPPPPPPSSSSSLPPSHMTPSNTSMSPTITPSQQQLQSTTQILSQVTPQHPHPPPPSSSTYDPIPPPPAVVTTTTSVTTEVEIQPPEPAHPSIQTVENNENNSSSNNNNGEEEGSPILYSIVVEPEIDEAEVAAKEAAEREKAAAREKAEKEAAARAAKLQEELAKVSPESLIYTKKDIGLLQDILDLFIEKSPQTIGLLFEKVSKDKFDEFANAMVTLSFAHSTTLPLVLYFVGDEFARNGHLEGGLKVLFRENSVASKMLKAYLAHVGGPYLQELLGDIIRDICFVEQKVSFEIDPGRAEGGAAEVEHNLAALTSKLESVMQRITSDTMIAKMPQGIRAIAAYFAESSRKYWPDKPSDILLGSFLMLRYINPAIAAPETAGLLPKTGRYAGQQLSQKARRNLLLITKVLQNMSNCVFFTQKEQFMLPLNGFLQTYMPQLQKYYQNIINVADTCSTNLVMDSDIVEPGPREAHNFHRLLFAFKNEIVPALLPAAEDQQRLTSLMDMLGSYAFKASFPLVLGAEPEKQAPFRALLAKYHDAPVFVAPFETAPETAGGSFYSLGTEESSTGTDDGGSGGSNDNVIIVGANRIFIARKQAKGSILKCNGHFLDLVEIRSRGTRELKLTFRTFSINGFCDQADEVIECAIRAYMANFGAAPPSQRFRIDTAPQSRADAVTRTFAAAAAAAADRSKQRGAAALLGTYASLSDYYGQQANEGVCWDLENLYSTETTLDLRRFGLDEGGADQEELAPLFHALRYDKHFKGIICEDLKLKSVVPQLGETLKLNTSLTILTLANAGINDKMAVTLFDALLSNKGCAITTLDLSNNAFDEKGAVSLARFICARALAAASSASSSGTPAAAAAAAIPPPSVSPSIDASPSSTAVAASLDNIPEGVDPGVVKLNIEGSIESTKAVSAFGVELAKIVHPTLRVLNMAHNKIGDAFNDIGVFLHIGGAEIIDLDVSSTSLSGQKLTGFLQYVAKGCKQLVRLGAANLKFTNPEDILFVSKMLISNNSLRDLDLSGSLPNARCLGDLLVCAHADASVRVSIANNAFSESANVLYRFLPKIKALSHLDLSNTDLGDDGIFHVAEGLTLNTALRSLNISGCFHPDKRPRQDAIRAIEKLINSDCPLEEFFIAGGQKTGQQLGKYLPQLLQAFRANKTVTVLDVSGHAAGSRGALALSKLLTVNKTLREVRIDHNNIGINGLSVIAQSLKSGTSLVSFPLPIIDIAAMINTSLTSNNQEKIHTLCMDIEKSLISNNNK